MTKENRQDRLAAELECLRALKKTSNIFDFEADDIAAAQLAIDRQIEQSQVADTSIELQARPYGPDMSWL